MRFGRPVNIPCGIAARGHLLGMMTLAVATPADTELLHGYSLNSTARKNWTSVAFGANA